MEQTIFQKKHKPILNLINWCELYLQRIPTNILTEKDNLKLNEEELKEMSIVKKILHDERNKRIKPFFDNKVQTDLNCFWLYSNLNAALVLKDDKLFVNTLISTKKLIKQLKNDIYHCYEKSSNKVNVFLDDYAYLSLLLITLYELENDDKSLELCKKIMLDTWELFFNDEYNLLQKNIIKNNDLFINPIDISDNNIPNGNSVYLIVCNKLKNITRDSNWQNKIDLLSKTFHSYINYNFSQMFSFIKTLDVCEKNITINFHGEYTQYINILKQININNISDTTIIHNEDKKDFFVIICKDQTCSQKLKNINEIKNYLDKLYND